MISSTKNINAVITKGTCCAAFLIIVVADIYLNIKGIEWVEPPWWVLVVGCLLMGYSVTDLVGNLRGGK